MAVPWILTVKIGSTWKVRQTSLSSIIVLIYAMVVVELVLLGDFDRKKNTVFRVPGIYEIVSKTLIW